MTKFNKAEQKAQEQKHPKKKYKVFGCYLGSMCIYTGSASLCTWYKLTYNRSLKIRGVS